MRSVAGTTPVIRKSLLSVLVVLLTATAFVIRVQRLAGADGDLSVDEARLALTSQGVLATGLPKVPSGRIYLRGVISTYLMAPSLWLFGPHDFAARLPSAVVGALLIPLVFAFGRAVAGTAGGLCAAVFVAVQPDLIKWSDNAWMSSLFVLVFVGTAYLLYWGYGDDRSSMQLAGGVGFVLALLVHELAVLLPMAVLATLAIREVRGEGGWFTGPRSGVALLTLGFGMVLFVALGLFLRMGTIAGPTSEFRAYLISPLTLDRVHFYYERLLSDHPLLLATAAGGILVWLRSPKMGILFLYMTLAVPIVILGFFIAYVPQERYGIILLPLLAIIAAWAIAEGMRLVTDRLTINPAAARALPPIVLVLVFGLSVQGDLRAAVYPDDPPVQTWLTVFRTLNPASDDLVLTDVPTIVAFYLGRADYWARVENYKRYGYIEGDVVRELYTGAVRVSSERDFQEVVEANPGRKLWYVGHLRRFRHSAYVPPSLRDRLLRTAQVSRRVLGDMAGDERIRDDWVILRIDLGAQDLKRR